MMESSKTETLKNVTYSYLQKQFTKKLMVDYLENKITLNDYRYISRALDELANILDSNEVHIN